MFRFFLFVSLWPATACSDGVERVEERFPGGQLRSVSFGRNGKLHGLRVMYWPSGQAHLEMHYVNGRLHGSTVRYYPTGNRMTVLHYRNDQPQGPYQYFRPDGSLDFEGNLDGPKIERGPLRHYYPNGQLKRVQTFRNGKATGPDAAYLADGRLKYRGSQRDGRAQGWSTLFNPRGTDSVRMRFDNGRVVEKRP